MNQLRIITWLLPKHLRSSWINIAIILVGACIALVSVGLGYIYSQAISEAGLQYAIASSSPGSLNIRITTQNRPIAPEDYSALQESIERVVDDNIGFLVQNFARNGRTQSNLSITNDPMDTLSLFGGPIGRPFFLTDFEKHSNLLEGTWPSTAETEHSDNHLQIDTVIGNDIAKLMHYSLGDTVYILPYKGDTSELIIMNIVGIAEPNDPQQEYWMGTPSYFTIQKVNDKPIIPFYVNEDDFINKIGNKYPNMVGDYEWLIFINANMITPDIVVATQGALENLETEINKQFPRSTVLTYLENSHRSGLLSKYTKNKLLAQIPIFLFISLILVADFYFLITIITLFGQGQYTTSSLINSRGANFQQIFMLQSSTYFLIIFVAFLGSPFLADIIADTWLLTSIPSVSGLGKNLLFSSPHIWVWTGCASAITLLVLILSGGVALKRTLALTTQNKSRPSVTPMIQKFYIDGLIGILFLLLLWQTQSKSGFVEENISDNRLFVEPSLLIGPALGFMLGGLLLMRLAPYILRVITFTIHFWAPSWAVYTLTKMSRDPFGYSAVSAVLMLSMTLGVFASAFQPTLSSIESSQALYEIGGDLVITDISFSKVNQDEELGKLTSIPGVQHINPVLRENVKLVDQKTNKPSELLAIEPKNMESTTWFREDFSDTSSGLDGLIRPMLSDSIPTPDKPGGVPIPYKDRYIGIKVNVDVPEFVRKNQWIRFTARISDSYGHYTNIELGEIATGTHNENTYETLSAPLPSQFNLIPPLLLTSVFVTASPSSNIPNGSIHINSLISGEDIISESHAAIPEFNSIEQWQLLPNTTQATDSLKISQTISDSDSPGLTFSWSSDLNGDARGLFIPTGPFPLPTIGSPEFSVGEVVHVQAGREIIPLKVVGTTQFFPTISPKLQPFFIVPVTEYINYATRIGRPYKGPEEFWLSLEDNADRKFIVSSLNEKLSNVIEVKDRDAAVSMALNNPLSGGAWESITFVSIVVLVLTSLISLTTHSVLTSYRTRTDVVVTRVLGLTKPQMILSLIFEKLFICVIAIPAGLAMGTILYSWILSYMGTTQSGQPIVPPMIIDTQLNIVVLSLCLILLSAIVAVIMASITGLHYKTSDILRSAG